MEKKKIIIRSELIFDFDEVDSERPWKVPFKPNDLNVLYFPKVKVFRKHFLAGYELEKDQYTVPVLCATLPADVIFYKKQLDFSVDEINEDRFVKIANMIFSIALHNGHDSVVLAPLGTNEIEYYRPETMARVLYEVLVRNFYGLFRRVIVCIPPNINYVPIDVTLDAYYRFFIEGKPYPEVYHIPCQLF